MGVPAFFRWLSRKYPSIVVHCVEEKHQELEDGTKVPIDTSGPNPNDYEFDNLYLDMNGIIHPCTHPEDKPAPKNEAEMFVAIFEYIDRIFGIIRPRRVLYMAIDGVAPRAKMNQQRSRRFRAAKEAAEKTEEINRMREELISKGATLPPEKSASERFDSNCITPGTPFFDRLEAALRYYIHDRLNSDPGWRGIQVYLSDANAPGEGEHKIMDFIRRQRAQPGHDPNTRHCLCGADADLIMLGLATHEPHFTIIREEFVPNKPKPCELCGQMDHEMKDCLGLPKEDDSSSDKEKITAPQMFGETSFIFIRLNVLREYLERELKMDGLPFQYDFERAVDDWVLMCFFVGNDFLPHLPSLEIRENAIDRLVNLYKDTVYRTGGWLTDSGRVNLSRVQLVLSKLGEVEDEIFKRRRSQELNFRRRNKMNRGRGRGRGGGGGGRGGFGQGQHQAPGGFMAPQSIRDARNTQVFDNLAAADSLRAMLRDARQNSDSPVKQEMEPPAPEVDSDEERDASDEVKLWEDGWKARYYESKFGVHPDESRDFRVAVAHQYARGLCWVLAYYYQGCASWTWYFPYHYAPFASDFVGIADLKLDFDGDAQPFKPLEQLMAVFPAASRQHLPAAFGELMCDPESPIIDFYPTNFRVDLNGKKFAWMGVALLPFVDEKRLLRALTTVYGTLSPEEKHRNRRGEDRVFIRSDHPAAPLLLDLYKHDNREGKAFELDTRCTEGVGGSVLFDHLSVEPGATMLSAVPSLCPDLHNCHVASAFYRDPHFPKEYVFPARLLSKVTHPARTLKPEDFQGPYRPNIGFGAHGGHRAPGSGYSPNVAQRMLRHSVHNMQHHNTRLGPNAGPSLAAWPSPQRPQFVAIPPPSGGYGRGGRGGRGRQSYPSGREDRRYRPY